MADVASTPSKPPSPTTHTSPSHPTLPPPPNSGPAPYAPSSPHLRAPTPSAISISSTSIHAMDDVEALPSANSASDRATDAHSPPQQGPPTSSSQHLDVPEHVRVISSSSSAAAGVDTDTDLDRDAPQHLQVVAPQTDGEAPPPDSTAAPTKKPKSKVAKKPRNQSPSPPPIPKPPPRMTIRLNIDLGGPSNYEVSILDLAKQSGQRPPTPDIPRVVSDSSSSEDEGEGPLPTAVKGTRRRRRADYDLEDPFIDDSDLVIDAPTHFAQTKQQGFYVSSGDVALVKDKTPKKMKPGPGAVKPVVDGRRRQGPSLASLLMNATVLAEAPAKVAPINGPGSEAQGDGTRDSPIALLDDEEADRKPFPVVSGIPMDGIVVPPAAKKMKLDEAGSSATTFVAHDLAAIGPSDSYVTAATAGEGAGKKRKISKDELEKLFNPIVTEALRGLKDDIDKADWSVKGKFPPQIKPKLQQVATIALHNGDYNDNFFDYLPTIFPYNRFTMMKLTSRLMYQEHVKFLQDRQDALLEELKQIATEDFQKAQDEYARACVAWEERQKRKAAAGDGTPATGMDVDTPSRAPSPAANESDAPAAGGANKREREDKPPTQKYKWTNEIKMRVWGLVHLSNESARLTNMMHAWDSNIPATTEQSLRKSLYTRITAVFPDGWMNSQQISREVSNMKLKLKKEIEQGSTKTEE